MTDSIAQSVFVENSSRDILVTLFHYDRQRSLASRVQGKGSFHKPLVPLVPDGGQAPFVEQKLEPCFQQGGGSV